MDFEFQRMDFDNIQSIARYGEEILEEARMQNGSGRGLIDVNMRDEELKALIKSIPSSIDDEIDKNIDEEMPVSLNLLDKLLSVKLIDKVVPNFLSNKVIKKVDEAKNDCENNNSVTLYNTIMSNVDSIRMKVEDEYHNVETVVNALSSSKETLIELSRKFDVVIESGQKDLENFINNAVEDQLKENKIQMANTRLLSLRNVRASFNGFIQQKDITASNLFMYLIKIQDWLDVNYTVLSHSVEVAIESKYINNRTKQLKDLVDTSNKVMLDSAETLKETTEMNVTMLKSGSVDINAMNRYLKTVNDALVPIQGFIEGKDNTIKKLMSDMDKMEAEISKNYVKLESIHTNHVVPAIEEPKTLRLEMKQNHE